MEARFQKKQHDRRRQPSRDAQRLHHGFEPGEPTGAQLVRRSENGTVAETEQTSQSGTGQERRRHQWQKVPAGMPADAAVIELTRQGAQAIQRQQRKLGQKQPVDQRRREQGVQETKCGRPQDPGRPSRTP